MPLSIVILAAGQGTRMKSSRPKVLHRLAGKSMLQHVIDTSLGLEPEQIIVVVGHKAEQVQASLEGQNIHFVEQREQLGTGHALKQCLDEINSGNEVLVLFGDVPLIRKQTLSELISHSKDAALGILGFEPDDASGYGRIVRQNNEIRSIVEQSDTDSEQRKIRECFSGIMLIRGDRLKRLIGCLDNDNAQGEFYLTDLVAIAVTDGETVTAVECADSNEVRGVNNQQQLAAAEAIYRSMQAASLMNQGVKLYDPERIDIRGEVDVGQDVEIDINCVFEGKVSLGDGVIIGANCVIRNTSIDAGSVILPMTSIDDSVIGRNVSIGPFARLRPGARLDDEVKIGNFVEIKKSHIGSGSKVNHLSYIGDTDMGGKVNIGAGSITCNYDGANKFKTIIEDDVFIGSNTQLVAPVRVGRNATIGAGSVITRDAPADKLTVSRSRQVTIESWSKPVKEEK
jgi:bifunctional UDP-N-acetylglucosamine pyrophosphorylase/glucosamine-1-phosphate N-acetyltransferase